MAEAIKASAKKRVDAKILADLAKIEVRTELKREGRTASYNKVSLLKLDWSDIDAFNKPWPIQNIDYFKQETD